MNRSYWRWSGAIALTAVVSALAGVLIGGGAASAGAAADLPKNTTKPTISGAARDGVLDQLVDLRASLVVDEGADQDTRQRARTDLERPHALDEPRHEAVGDRRLDEDPVGADARLAADAQEGITAFLEKRKPCWTGK